LGPVGFILMDYYIFLREWSITFDKGTCYYMEANIELELSEHIFNWEDIKL
jgi:hypothetical protein